MHVRTLMVFSAFLTFIGKALSSPLSNRILTLSSFNESDVTALNASAFNLPTDTFYRFPVRGTPVSLDLYAFEEDIPRVILFATLSAAVVLIQTVVEKYPTREITDGKWAYQYHTQDGALCTFSVNDLSQVGKPLTYSHLLDALRGLIEFFYEKRLYKTLYYIVDIRDVGLSAIGRIDYAEAASAAATVAVT